MRKEVPIDKQDELQGLTPQQCVDRGGYFSPGWTGTKGEKYAAHCWKSTVPHSD
jgi:hypothetical protein